MEISASGRCRLQICGVMESWWRIESHHEMWHVVAGDTAHCSNRLAKLSHGPKLKCGPTAGASWLACYVSDPFARRRHRKAPIENREALMA